MVGNRFNSVFLNAVSTFFTYLGYFLRVEENVGRLYIPAAGSRMRQARAFGKAKR